MLLTAQLRNMSLPLAEGLLALWRVEVVADTAAEAYTYLRENCPGFTVEESTVTGQKGYYETVA